MSILFEGEIASGFGDLLKKLWAPGASPVAPRTFKLKLAHFAAQFSGYNQHDSQGKDRPVMSEVVRMLVDGEAQLAVAERWKMWQHVESARKLEYERLQKRFDWGDDDSIANQDAIQLSGGH